jgi:hypothetical protein
MGLRGMDSTLHQTLYARLIADYGFEDKGTWLQKGRCPECGKKEVFTHTQHPWILRCGRQNRCGWEQSVKDLYGDLFDNWSTRFPVCRDQPNAAAEAYLRDARGFDVEKIRGWYTQGQYRDSVLHASSATVRFTVEGIVWERLIDQPERFGKKAHFKTGSSYAGLWWQPPTLNIQAVKDIWLVEGIFDAIALDHHGIAAVALLSCTNYPEKALARLTSTNHRPRLIWGLDSDKAGQRGVIKGIERARKAGWKCKAAQIPQGKNKLDWNDLHQSERLSKADLETYLYHGALLIADSPFERGRLLHQKNGLREFAFDYGRRLYWFKLDQEQLDRAREAAQDSEANPIQGEAALKSYSNISEIANCAPIPLYYQAHAATDEAWYYFRIDFPNAPSIKSTFTGTQIACASEFRKRLLTIAPGAFYSGNSTQLDRYLRNSMAHIRSIQTIDFIGYSSEHECYVFKDIAIRKGQVVTLNEEDFFELGSLSLKTLSQLAPLSISREKNNHDLDWLTPFWACFGAKGIIALAFWFGSLFAEQIRAEHKSFPFLEIVGEPGAGKSTLIEFLWKLLGRRDYEGFDPSKSSLAARARNFAQVSCLPVVLIEGERQEESSKYARFDWDELKTAYNGRCVRATGIKNSGNETREPPFRGSVVISQNTPICASEAILQRLIHLNFDCSLHTSDTRAYAETLERMPVEQLSHFILHALTKEAAVMQRMLERTYYYEQQLHAQPGISNVRIVKNHAQLMALLEVLVLIIPISDVQQKEVQAQLVEMAKQRQHMINTDHPVVQEFWDTFDYLEGDGEPKLNHSSESQLIAINLNDFAKLAAEQQQKIPPLIDLKRHLRSSRTRKFIEIKTIRSAIRSAGFTRGNGPETLKCWFFQRGKHA